MNFLAHCALANDASNSWPAGENMRQGLLAGAILADFGKGPVPTSMPNALQTGIRLHRRIDAFSNQQTTIREVCTTFPANLRRYAPIFLDILGYYYLSKSWDLYYDEPRHIFSQRCYAACAEFRDSLQGNSSLQLGKFLSYMRETDLLANYDEWQHVERGLHSVLRRLGQEGLSQEVKEAAIAQRDTGEAAFRIYFADLRSQLPHWSALATTHEGSQS